MQLTLPTELLDDLADWQEHFDTNFRPETGWINPDLATQWARRGDELAAALRTARPPKIPSVSASGPSTHRTVTDGSSAGRAERQRSGHNR